MNNEIDEKNLSINGPTVEKRTPLHRALEKLRGVKNMMRISKVVEIIERLLISGADPNAPDVNGQTPLHYLFYLDNVPVDDILSIFQRMADRSVDVNHISTHGDTPLILFVSRAYVWRKKPENRRAILSLLDELIKCDVDPFPVTMYSLRASQLARQYHMDKLAEKIEKYEAEYASRRRIDPPVPNQPYPKKKASAFWRVSQTMKNRYKNNHTQRNRRNNRSMGR